MDALPNFIQQSIRHLPVDQAIVQVKAGSIFARLPNRADDLVFIAPVNLHLKILDGLEIFNRFLAANYHCHGRRFDAADPQTMITCLPCRCGKRSRIVHAHRPISAASGTRSISHAGEIDIIAQIVQCVQNRFFIQRVQQNTPNGLFIPHFFQQLVDQELSLSIRIACVNHHIGFL